MSDNHMAKAHSEEWKRKIAETVKKTWRLRALPEKKCERCKVIFIPTGRRHKFCGSESLKTGCSWKNHLERKSGDQSRGRRSLIEKQNFSCEHCGLQKVGNYSFFDIDHKIAIKRRKNKLYRNSFYKKEDIESGKLQVLCPNCHRLKTIANGDNKGK